MTEVGMRGQAWVCPASVAFIGEIQGGWPIAIFSVQQFIIL